jgi:hypothetical protein
MQFIGAVLGCQREWNLCGKSHKQECLCYLLSAFDSNAAKEIESIC